jgi:cell wall-associated NlpC family hydrolase
MQLMTRSLCAPSRTLVASLIAGCFLALVLGSNASAQSNSAAVVSNRTPAVEQKKNDRDILKIISDAEGKLAATLALPAMESSPNSEPSLGQFSSELVLRAMTLLGINYKFGGNTPETGFDCSGLVRYVFKEAFGLNLPRRAEEISQKGQRVTVDQLVPGDLVFFNTLKRTFSHVGIYIGNNQFVHAPSSGKSVTVENIDKSYWQTRFDGARRLITGEATSPAQ